MRIDLGLIQMELNGRPDGERPGGFESLLELYEAKRAEVVAQGEPFTLEADDCSALMREGLQYYHRYVSAFQLERYDLVARDTARNLRLFAFVARHAARQRDRIEFDRIGPTSSMMHARAKAAQALRRTITRPPWATSMRGSRQSAASSPNTRRRNTRPSAPSSASCAGGAGRSRTTGRSGRWSVWNSNSSLAVTLEDYEEAGRIRDQIQRLRDGDPAKPGRSA